MGNIYKKDDKKINPLEIKFDENGMILTSECNEDFSLKYEEEREKYPLLGLAYSKWDSDIIKKILDNGVDCNCKQYEEAIEEFATEESYQHICERNHYSGNDYFVAVEILIAYKEERDYTHIYNYQKAIGKRIKDIKILYNNSLLKNKIKEGNVTFFHNDILFMEFDDKLLIIGWRPNIWVASKSYFNDYNKAESIKAALTGIIEGIFGGKMPKGDN